jgi:hypothetical protein
MIEIDDAEGASAEFTAVDILFVIMEYQRVVGLRQVVLFGLILLIGNKWDEE